MQKEQRVSRMAVQEKNQTKNQNETQIPGYMISRFKSTTASNGTNGGSGGEGSQSSASSPPSDPPPPPPDEKNNSSAVFQSSSPPPLASPPPRSTAPSPAPPSRSPPPPPPPPSTSTPPPEPTPERSSPSEPSVSPPPPPPPVSSPPPLPVSSPPLPVSSPPPIHHNDSKPVALSPLPPSVPSFSPPLPPPPSPSSSPSPVVDTTRPAASIHSPPAVPPQSLNPPKISPFLPPKVPLDQGPPSLPTHHVPNAKNSSGNTHQSNSNVNGGSSNDNNNYDNDANYNEKTMVVLGLSAAIIFTVLAIVIFVKSRKDKRVARRPTQQYMPPANFSIKSDGYNYYGQKLGNGGNNSAQNSSSGNSSGSQRLGGGTPDSAVIGSSKTLFTYDELTQITNGFSKTNIIGEGGFGCVYKGFFSDGKIVAVKQLKPGCGQGYKEFKAEIEIISRVHHRHLVSLVGYCISEQHRLLVYEFVPNRTLDYHLHNKGLPVLDWAKRVKIAICAAKGLAYLHEDCHPKIIHRDIKSANILLHDDFEAQVADFGLARLYDTSQTHVSTRVMGTFGYLAPEYASSGKLTDRSDVFSYGVVLLELITGRKPVDSTQPIGEESLVEWARPYLIEAIETGDVSNLVDPRLEKHYVGREVYRMIETAASCVRHSALKRPRMIQVMRALDSEGDMSDLTNGVKVGQSTIYDSIQYSQEIRNFRRMTSGSDDFSDSFPSGDGGDYGTSHESESRALNHTRLC